MEGLMHYGEDKVFPVHDMQAYRGRRGMAPLILNLDNRWTSVVAFMSWTFSPGKEPL
jgi:hypothetical protein